MDEPRIDALFRAIDRREEGASDLGTPDVAATPETNEIEALGRSVVPLLLRRLQDASPKVTAYLVPLLARLGGDEAAQGLHSLRRRYQAAEPKTPWHYAVIGQCDLALER